MLAALDIMPSPSLLPVTHRQKSRKWRTSDVVPMGGRIIFERLTCLPEIGNPDHQAVTKQKHHHPRHIVEDSQQLPLQQSQDDSPAQNGTFVRININDGIVALPNCSNSGPGSSCPLEEFLAHLRRRGEEVGDFRELCGLGPETPDRITFLHQ